MGDKIRWGDIGDGIRRAVNESIQTGDFTKLGDCLTDTAYSIFGYQQPNGRQSESSTSAHKTTDPGNENAGKYSQNKSYYVPKDETFTEKWIRENKQRKLEEDRQKLEIERSKPLQGVVLEPPFNRIGRVSGILFSVFGGIGIGIGTLLMMAFKMVMAITGIGMFGIGMKASGFLLGGSIIMMLIGRSKHKRLAKAKKYYNVCRINRYCNIDELALRMNMSAKTVLKDIKKFLRIGFFPQGHLNKEKTCFMLDDRIYNEYLEIDKQRSLLLEAEANTEKPASDNSAPQPNTEDSELDVMISEGESCILRLRKMNDNIPGEEISDKLFRLEKLLKEIFERLKDHPEQKGQMHKFMDYYLPMTLKLVGAYEEFDSLSVQGEDIAEAKREIEKTLDTINDAFGELLIRLFKDAAFDAATDAQVLQTMLAKEGLTQEQSFKTTPNN